jgi:Protein of unknown function (DUF3105)
MRLLERAVILLTSLALSFGLIALLSGFFQSRDNAALGGETGGPGQHFRDLGNRILAPGELRPAYDSNPPTSGAHVLSGVPRDRVPLDDNQLLSALAVGDVVIMYGTPHPPGALIDVARSVAGQFTASLAATGQAVILAPSPHTQGFLGLAWTHILRVPRADDPRLSQFAAYWLGRGAPR